MTPLQRMLLPGVIAGSLLFSLGCPAQPPGVLRVGEMIPGTGALTLTFAVPADADRHVAYVPIASSKSVRVTVLGPKYRDDTKGVVGGAYPLMQTVQTANLASGTTATVTVSGIHPGKNLTVKVEVFDGSLTTPPPSPPAGFMGAPTGNLIETLYGLVDVTDGQTSAATINGRTSPTGLAIDFLRHVGDPNRVVGTDGAALQTLVDTLMDTPTANYNHPSLINISKLGTALLRYTQAQDNWPIGQGYAIPAATDPLLTGVVAQAAHAPSTKLFDLRGTELTTNVSLLVRDPISAQGTAAPFAFPTIAPGDWQVYAAGTNGDTRTYGFTHHFAEGDADALHSAYLAGNAAAFAGTGAAGTGTPAAPQFNNPHQLALDALGNLFVADTGNHRVVKVDATGAMTVVAGTGTAGATGDNAAATAATLNAPEGVAVDVAGNVFIADTGNHKIRVVEAATGIIRLLAGTGTAGFDGDGASLSKMLSGPTNLAVGGTNPVSLYVHDSGNMMVRRIPIPALFTSGASITSLALSDLTSQNTGLAYQTVSGVDYLYYCTFNPPRVVRLAMNGTNQKLVVAGGGYAKPPLEEGNLGDQVAITQVRALAADSNGDVYIGEYWPSGAGHGRVRLSNPAKFTEIYTVLGLSGSGTFPGGGKRGPDTAIGTALGLAVSNVATAPLYVATGGSDHRVVKLAP